MYYLQCCYCMKIDDSLIWRISWNRVSIFSYSYLVINKLNISAFFWIFRWQHYHTLYIIWRHRLIGIYNWESINIATIAISPHTDDMSNLIVRIIKSDSKHSFIPGFFMRKSIVKIYLESLKRIPNHMKWQYFEFLLGSIRDVQISASYLKRFQT